MEPTFGFYALTPILRSSSLFVRNDVINPRITPKTTYCSEDTNNSIFGTSVGFASIAKDISPVTIPNATPSFVFAGLMPLLDVNIPYIAPMTSVVGIST